MSQKSSLAGWLKKSGWSVTDQALFAGSNFLVNVLLARWLTEADYGSFAFCFSLFLYLGAIHTGLLTEPMLVFGPGRFKDKFASYTKLLRKKHFLLTAFLSAILLGGAALFLSGEHASFAIVIVALAVSSPFMLFVWLNRRSCYVIFEPRYAVAGGLLYLLSILMGLYALLKLELLSSISALLLIGFAGLIASLVIIRLLKRIDDGDSIDPELVVREHWKYGRWSVSTGILQMTPGQLSLLVLPVWAGIEASAELKALSNLLMPIMHAYVALTVLMVPAFVKAYERGKLKPLVWKLVLIISLLTGIYAIGLVLFGEAGMDFLYKGKYTHLAVFLPLAALIPIASSAVAVLSAAIKATERPDLVFWANLSSAILMLSLGIYLIRTLEVEGALWAQLISICAGLVVLIFMFLRQNIEDEGGQMRNAS